MSTKWFIVYAAVFGAMYIGKRLRYKPKYMFIPPFLIGFLPFYGLEGLAINPITEPSYRGDSRGFEVTIIDILAVVLAVAFAKKPKVKAPLFGVTVAYLLVCWFSWFMAAYSDYALWSAWKSLRAYFLAVVLTKALRDTVIARWLIRGLAVGLIYVTFICLKQRYVEGLHQIYGTFHHQNTLGMAVYLVAPIFFSIMLMRPAGPLNSLALGCGAVVAVLSLSRGVMMVYPATMGMVYFGSLTWKITPRKIMVGFAALICLGGVMAKSLDSIVARFTNAPKASERARERFEHASALMLDDKPMGIGMNNFSAVLEGSNYAYRANIRGYDSTGLVHNIYWLTLAELGYLGLITYVLVTFLPILMALKWAWLGRGDLRAQVILAGGAALLGMAIHGKLEWIARQTVPMYLFWILVALIFSFSRQIKRKVPFQEFA
ncbi:MAG: O-antigen ligase family protein [Acidobacteriota bacterium]